MDDTAELLKALARAKVAFQARTLETVIRGEVLPVEALPMPSVLSQEIDTSGGVALERLRPVGPP